MELALAHAVGIEPVRDTFGEAFFPFAESGFNDRTGRQLVGPLIGQDSIHFFCG